MSVTKTGESERGCRGPVKLIKQNPSMDSPQQSGHIWERARLGIQIFTFHSFTAGEGEGEGGGWSGGSGWVGRCGGS